MASKIRYYTRTMESMINFYISWVLWVTLYCYMGRYAIPEYRDLYDKISIALCLLTVFLIIGEYLNGTLF